MKVLVMVLLFTMNIMADNNYQKNTECEKSKKLMLEKINSVDEVQLIKSIECSKNNQSIYGELDTLESYVLIVIFGAIALVFVVELIVLFSLVILFFLLIFL